MKMERYVRRPEPVMAIQYPGWTEEFQTWARMRGGLSSFRRPSSTTLAWDPTGDPVDVLDITGGYMRARKGDWLIYTGVQWRFQILSDQKFTIQYEKEKASTP